MNRLPQARSSTQCTPDLSVRGTRAARKIRIRPQNSVSCALDKRRLSAVDRGERERKKEKKSTERREKMR